MTRLNIRKNVAQALHMTADAVGKMQVPDIKTIKDKVYDIRCRTAALVMPHDAQLVITPKN